MTNIEILNANLLDIVFENRNKDYGAYALRKGYNNRMFTALAAGLSVILLFVFISTTGKSKSTSKPDVNTNEGIVIRTIEMPKEKVKELEKPKEVLKQKPVQKIASANYTTPPKIEKDKEVKHAMVAVKELDNKEISNKTTEGKVVDNMVVIKNEIVENTGNGGTATTTGPSQPDFAADERDPQFRPA